MGNRSLLNTDTILVFMYTSLMWVGSYLVVGFLVGLPNLILRDFLQKSFCYVKPLGVSQFAGLLFISSFHLFYFPSSPYLTTQYCCIFI